MERSLDKTDVQQDQKDMKGRKHEGVRENRPERPIAAEGKPQDIDAKDVMASEAQAGLDAKDIEAGGDRGGIEAEATEDIAAGQTEQTETRDKIKVVGSDKDEPSQAV